MTALLLIFLWLAAAGLTSIPLSRTEGVSDLLDEDVVTVGFLSVCLVVAWPAFLTCAAIGWLAKRLIGRSA